MTRLSERIKAANAAKLSKRSSIPADRLSELASGAEPSLSELRRLATALRIALEDLVPPPSTKAQRAGILFRGAGQEGEHVALTERLSQKIGYSLDILPRSPTAQWLEAFSAKEDSYQEAEGAAVRFRELFYADDQVSPLFDLPQVLANVLGVVVFVINSSEIDGASAYVEGVPFIFVSSQFPPRMLFTVGHELAHLVANRNEESGFAVLDSKTDSPPRGSAWTTQERFAHAFASCLLMPKAGVGIVLKKVRDLAGVADRAEPPGDIELLYLSRIFGVSFEAAARRCEDLQLLPRGAGASINAELKKEYGSAEKRAAALDLPPRPAIRFSHVPEQLLTSAVRRIRAGELSVGKAAAILGISVADLISANAPTAH